MKTEEVAKILTKEELKSIKWVIGFGFGFMGFWLTCLGILLALLKYK